MMITSLRSKRLRVADSRHPVDRVVHDRVLLDVRVRRRDVRLRLVVVVVRHEVLDRVVREELPELLVELRSQRLVVGQDQRRPLHLLDDIGHRECLPGPRDAEQHLVLVAAHDAIDELLDSLWLITGRGEGGAELEVGHRNHGATVISFLIPRPLLHNVSPALPPHY